MSKSDLIFIYFMIEFNALSLSTECSSPHNLQVDTNFKDLPVLLHSLQGSISSSQRVAHTNTVPTLFALVFPPEWRTSKRRCVYTEILCKPKQTASLMVPCSQGKVNRNGPTWTDTNFRDLCLFFPPSRVRFADTRHQTPVEKVDTWPGILDRPFWISNGMCAICEVEGELALEN